MGSALLLDLGKVDDTEAGALVRDAWARSLHVIVYSTGSGAEIHCEPRCHHDVEKALCVACGDEEVEAERFSGATVSVHVSCGDSTTDWIAVQEATEAVGKALGGMVPPETVVVDCPQCSGEGKVQTSPHPADNPMTKECPLCRGRKTVVAYGS